MLNLMASKKLVTSRADKADVDLLWADYKATGNRDARDRLVTNYWPFLEYVAGRTFLTLVGEERSDIISYGVFGLLDAIEKFEPERGWKFETYAIQRIKGAIVDELRSIDWVPRSIRDKTRDVDHAYSRLHGTLHRVPEESEVAVEMGVTVAELRRMLAQISYIGIVALDEAIGADGTTTGDLVAGSIGDPVGEFGAEELKRILADAVGRLPERERLVMTLYYYEDLTLAQTGKRLGVTESRVCQIHAKAIRRLREDF